MKLDPRIDGGPQHLQGSLGQEAEPAQDRQPQRRRQGRLRDLGLPVSGLDRTLLGQRPQQLGHEQRVARRPRDLGKQPRARLGGDRLRDQLAHRRLGESAQGELPGTGGVQRSGQPVQVRGRAGTAASTRSGPPGDRPGGGSARPASAGWTDRPTAGHPPRSPAARPARAPRPGRRTHPPRGTAARGRWSP